MGLAGTGWGIAALLAGLAASGVVLGIRAQRTRAHRGTAGAAPAQA